MTSKTIETYLQDHHAGSAAGVDAFRRVAQGHGDHEVLMPRSRVCPTTLLRTRDRSKRS